MHFKVRESSLMFSRSTPVKDVSVKRGTPSLVQGRSSVVLMYMILLRQYLYNNKLSSQLLGISFLYLQNSFLIYLRVPIILFPESLQLQLLLILLSLLLTIIYPENED